MVADLEAAEIGLIVAGVVLIAGFVYWRIRMSRKEKGTEEENPD
jgi:hypothetical protein